MIKRQLTDIAFSSMFGRQMRFIVGPRQCGKTTLARLFLDKHHYQDLYYNWDDRKIKDRYLEDNHFFSSDVYNLDRHSGKPWLCFDEIHKFPKWKNILKDFFDSYEKDYQFIVTGSAKLDMLRKSGDSLAGRYFSFRLYPLTLSEIIKHAYTEPPHDAEHWVQHKLSKVQYYEKELDLLLKFSGFPEPLVTANSRFHNKWGRDYLDRLIREDLRDLTRILELENIAWLMKLLPERISAPLSINSLARDLKCAFSSIVSYLRALELSYVIFTIKPYSHKVARSLTKESKVYFFDWTRVPNDAKRFENYVAMELKVLIDFWTDSGIDEFTMNYIRTRDGKETDFMIMRNNTPWFMVEVKLNRSAIDYHHKKNQAVLNPKMPFIQIVRESNVAEKKEPGIYQISASRFFS